jgi:hypothetical protein
MEQSDVFSRKIRWLAIAVGIAVGILVSVLYSFLSPVAGAGALLLPLAAALQPRLPNLGRRVVKWFVWVWAFGSSQVVVLSVLMLNNNFPHGHYFVVLRVLSTVLALLILWWDIELIIDGARRIRTWRSAPAREPRPIGLGLWIFAVALNLCVGWGLLNIISIYHGVAGDIYALAMSMVEAVIVIAFDIYLTWRVVKLWQARRADVQG